MYVSLRVRAHISECVFVFFRISLYEKRIIPLLQYDTNYLHCINFTATRHRAVSIPQPTAPLPSSITPHVKPANKPGKYGRWNGNIRVDSSGY